MLTKLMEWIRFPRRMGLVFKLSRKIIIAYLVLIFLPTCLFVYIYYERSANLLEKEVTQSMLQAIRQVQINISYRLSKIGSMSDVLIMNPSFLENLADDPSTVLGQLSEYKKLSDIIDTIQNNNEVYRVRLYVDPDKDYASEHVNFFNINDIKQESWYRKVLAAQGGIVWLPTHLQHYLGSEQDKYVFSCARIVRDPNNYNRVIGVLILDIPEEQIYRIINQVDFFHDSRQIYVVDGEGRLVVDGDKSNIGRIMRDYTVLQNPSASEGIKKIRRGNQNLYDIYRTIPSADWKIVAEISGKSINSKNMTYTSTIMLVLISASLLLFLFAAFAIFVSITESMVNRVKQISSVIIQEGAELYEDQVPMEGGAFMKLEKSVQNMIRTVRHYTEETYSAKTKQREAELRALQAQINPHFLYNTLEMMNWMAIRRGADEISQMLNKLAQYFRLSLSRGKDVLSIRDELKLAAVYMDIQMNRFPERFQYELDVDEAILQKLIPKITLQPVIENAILHGILKKKVKKGRIRITGEQLPDGDIILTVEDDGIGMEPSVIKDIWDSRNASKSYGLFNVNERIRLFYGEGYGIRIWSAPGEGTRVELRIQGSMNASNK